MLRRCALEISSSSARRCSLSSKARFAPRKAFSAAPSPPQGPPASSSGSAAPKILLAGAAVGAAVLAAREAGYIGGKAAGELHPETPNGRDARPELEPAAFVQKDRLEHAGREVGGESNSVAVGVDHDNGQLEMETGTSESSESASEEQPAEEVLPVDVRADELPAVELASEAAKESVEAKEVLPRDNDDVPELLPETESEIKISSDNYVTEDSVVVDVMSHEAPKDVNGYENEEPEPLAKSYLLVEETGPNIASREENSITTAPSSSDEGLIPESEVSGDESVDEKIVLDLIQAIHIAEKRQAELDFKTFDEEKRQIKEKYEKELRDARARELMYVEATALLDKELDKEKIKTAATLKEVQEKAEQNLKSELQLKEQEAEMQLRNARELGKAELNAAVAREKSSQVEKIAEANLHINALCMAFYARSEEARQNHSVHKLALGALALEEALSKGLPIQKEVEALHESLVDTKTDSLMDLVLSSLPNETVNLGTDTRLQLNQRFDVLKGAIRHFGLIPSGGGGILTHAVAHIASFVKVKESNTSGDGIECVISRVERLLAEGKLAEAAVALEQGVSGTEAEGAIGDWVRRTKNRAIVEQAVSLIRSYTTSISLS